jgi:hypothetical protein
VATPLTADRLVAALRAEGVKVVEVPGWRTNNRNHKGAWGPVNGVMIHHTVTGPKMSAVPLCFNGHSALPGPLCHGVIRRDGSVHLVGNGRANHAGGGDPNVLAAVIDERYNDYPPDPHMHDGSKGAVDGNARFYGFECENLGDGKDPWPAAQVEAIVRASAAISRAHGWGAKSVIGHLEWSDWKSDPKPSPVKGSVSVDMKHLRARITERLSHGPSWSPGAPTTPKPGGSMATPNHLHLSRSEDVTLHPGSPYTIYWSGEQVDEGNQHGAGNKTVAYENTDFSVSLHLSIDGLGAGDHVALYPVQEGTPESANGDVQDLVGADTGTVLTLGATFTGTVFADKQLVFRVVNQADHDVTLTHARLSGLFWPA